MNLVDVALSGMLYSAEKAQQTGKQGPAGIDLPGIRWVEILQRSKAREYMRLLNAADELASHGGRSSDRVGQSPYGGLKPVLGSIGVESANDSGGWSSSTSEYGGAKVGSYMPQPLSDTGRDPDGIRRLADELVKSLERLENPYDIAVVMNLFERYGSHLGFGVEGLSLFDYARTTATIAVCISGHVSESGNHDVEDVSVERYLFVRGDLSGVQEFIYTISSKGALRMLRSRSFFLELLVEHVVSDILRRTGVPRTNIVFTGGGGFQILLPNTRKSLEAVKAVAKDMNQYLAEAFGRTLYLAVAKTECSATGLTGGGLTDTVGKLGRDLSSDKARKFRESFDDLFGEVSDPGEESCAVCARDDTPLEARQPMSGDDNEEPRMMCRSCAMLDRASPKLSNHRYVMSGGNDLVIGNRRYSFSNDPQTALYALDGVGDEACTSGAIPFPVARYAMRGNSNRIMDFEGFSKKSAGANCLAVLRMDVDNLGETFRSGLPENMRTFGRYSALSRAFTTFFKMIVPRICDGSNESSLRLFSDDRERAVAIVYSGGDDLFVVGAWNDVLEIAVDIRREFRKFACENPSVSLSAGISVHKPGEPLYLMAEHAGEAEEEAKANEANGRRKDSIVFFYRGPDPKNISHRVPAALLWEEAEKVVEILEMVNTFRKDGKLPFPRGFTRLLMDVVDVYENEGYLSLPRLAYALARMEESGKLRDDERWRRLKGELLRVSVIEKQLRPAAYWLDLAERNGEGA